MQGRVWQIKDARHRRRLFVAQCLSVPLVLIIVAGAYGLDAGWGKAEPVQAESSASPDEPTPTEKASAMDHVMDSNEFHFFEHTGPAWMRHLHLPKIFGFQITKFMVLELIAAALVVGIYLPICRRRHQGEPPRGWWDNAFEVLLTFVREEIAKPAIGEHHADRYVPLLWTMFTFILFSNLLGIFPFMGSPTASIYVTGGLAACVFFAIHGSAVAEMGFGHYLKSLWPQIEVPFPLGYFITPLVCAIEVIGTLVRNAVLAVRLFANMFAGHMVLAVILLFITMAANLVFGLWLTITASSVLGVVVLSLLEIFVAFLQAYIFVFLTALFMGMAMHPQH